jgi:hypothetical protein
MKQPILHRFLQLSLIGVSLLLARWVVTGQGIIAFVHAQEDIDCIAYTIVGYTDIQQNFHTIAVEPGNCGDTELPLPTDLPGWTR